MKEMKKNRPNLKFNMLLSVIKGISSVIFPLITFPYIARVLQVDNIGKINFASSVIGYFLIFSRLGINDLAVRDGAKLKDTEEFPQFCNEIFTLNLLATGISYVALFVCIVASPKLQEYWILLLIQSLSMIFSTVGREWLYSVYEDYLYITIRSIVFQVLSLIALFAFVHKEEDYIIYAIISVIATSGANVVNLIKSQKLVPIRIKLTKYSKKLIRPIFTFFAATVSVSIFTNSDMILLGIMCSDYNVGIYTTAVKIFNILLSLLVSAIFTSLPRISSLTVRERDREELILTVKEVNDLLITISMPIAVGVIMMSPEIVLIFGGAEYSAAIFPLRILAVGFFCNVLSAYWGECILLPFGRENIVLAGSVISAMVNIVLNILLIPIWQENAAAITTLISLVIGLVITYVTHRKYIIIPGMKRVLIQSFGGCMVIVLMCWLIKSMIINTFFRLIISIVFSVIIYFVIEKMLGNCAVSSIISQIKNRMKIHE